jgi:cell wall-associated NlpC family hydrolase
MTRAIPQPGAALAQAAETLVGARFRLHGRDPATGLDCIGVLAAALAAIGRSAPLPAAYTLRARAPEDLDTVVRRCGLIDASGPTLPGDVVLVRLAATQLHLLIAAGTRRFVHAHAGLRRVVVHDAPLAWPLAGAWRLNDKEG